MEDVLFEMHFEECLDSCGSVCRAVIVGGLELERMHLRGIEDSGGKQGEKNWKRKFGRKSGRP